MRTKTAFTVLMLSVAMCLHAQTFQWSASDRKTSSSVGSYISKDDSGNVYVAGFNVPTGDKEGITTPGGSFISRYNTNGTRAWSLTGNDEDLRIAIAPGNSILVTGRDADGYYLAKYSTSGSQQSKSTLFAKNSNGIYEVQIKGLAADGSGNYYVMGVYRGSLSIGSDNFSNAEDENHLFVAKYLSNGTVSWARSSGSGHIFLNTCLFVDSVGNSYLGGDFMDTLSIGTDVLVCKGFSDGFIAKFNSSGTFQWTYHLSGGQQEFVSS